MAVEIPVVIDIDKAFEDAAKRAKTAMAPLKEYIESAPAELFIDVKVKGFGKTELVNLFDNAKTSVIQFQEALDQVNVKIDKLTAKGGFNLLGAGSLTKEESDLLKAAAALEAQLGKVGESSSSMARIFSANIKQAETSLNKYISKLDVLTAKQNKAATVTTIGDKKQLGTGAAYKRYAAEIEKVNAKISETRKFLSFCTLELDNITKASKTAGIAIGQMASQGQLVAAEWAKGHEALMRYNAALKTANGRAITLAKSIAGMALFYAPIRFIKNVREVTSEFEMQRVALGGIIQDTEKAQELFGQIKAAAIKSPFEIKDLVTYTKQLSAYRIETDKLFDVTMRLADISAGLGVDMNRLILAYGQVRAASVLRGQELRQFTEAGIPLVELLADKFSQLRGEMVSTADVFELISKRAVPFSMIEEIFNDMTDAGGIFYNMQEKQSETLKGQWMKLKDAVSIMYDEIGNTAAVHEAMEAMLSSLLKMFQNWKKMAQWIGAATASLIAYKVASANAAIATNALTLREAGAISAMELNVVGRSKLIASLFGEAAATKVQIRLGNAYVRAKKRELVATNLFSKALRRLQVALLSNPYTLAVAGAAALVAGLFALIKTTHQAAISTDEFAKSLTNFESRARTLGEQRGLIETYEQLADKADKTEQEQKKLDRATKELARTFPNAVTGINAETGALEINIQKIKELNKAEQELELARIRRDADRAKDRINTLEKEQNLILKKFELGGHYDFGPSGQVIPWTENELAKMGERLAEIRTELGKLQGQVEEVNQLDFVGPLTAEDAKAQGVLVGWKKRLNEIHAEKVKAGMPTVFTPNDIETMGSVSDLWKKTQKGIEDATKAVAAFKALSKTLTDQDAIEAQKTLDFWNAIKDAFGFSFSRSSGRDTRLSQLKSDISELTNAYKKFTELTKYKHEEEALIDINKMFPQLKGLAPTFDNIVAELKKKLADVKAQLARSPKSKTLLDMQRALETEISNLDFDKLKTDLDKQLKKLSDDLKRSETARNFYRNILDLTGDEKMAATLTMEVYGQTGKEFKERVQDEMFGALESVKNIIGEDFFNEMIGNVTIFDMKEIRKQVDKLPEIIRPTFERLLAEEEKTSADWITNLIKTYEKTKTYEERITDIKNREAQNRKEIEASDKLIPEQKATYTAASREKEAKDIAKVELEALKDTYTWTKAFEDLEGVSDRTLQNLIDLIDEYIKKNRKGLEPQQLKELTRAKENAKAQLMQRHSAEKLQDALSDLVKAREKQKKLEEEGKESTEDYTQSLDDQKRALKDMAEAIADMQSKFGQVTASLKDVNTAFMSDEDAAYYAEQIDNVTKSLEGLGKTAVGIAGVIADPADISSWLKAGTGLADIIVGIVNAINAAKVKKANDEIERQERAISDLEYAYNRLDKAIDESFGNARIYNYTQQVENLTQKLVKLEAELAAERSKGNKASQDAINGYLDKIRDTKDALADLKKSQADFWAGQELTSASEAFVDSWISAKKEFGDTTAAIEETMQQMVENLVSKAAMSGVVQAVLKPWYDELNQIEAWDTSTIARMVKSAYDKIPLINQGLEVAYSSLASAGVDIRRSVGNLTGISRNYATASEESILGLTAATNTQNYYMSYVPTIADHVAAIRMKVAGDVAPTVAPASAEGPSYEDQMLAYAANLPLMRSDTEAIRTMLERVIKPQGATATHYVSVRM